MMIVMAATPFSPANLIIVRLKNNVVTAVEPWLTISDEPLRQLSRNTEKSGTGNTLNTPPHLLWKQDPAFRSDYFQ